MRDLAQLFRKLQIQNQQRQPSKIYFTQRNLDWKRASCCQTDALNDWSNEAYFPLNMFSPNVNVGTSTRNPRRRQRTGSDDSASQRHRPKRLRRSGISADTFKPPSNKKVNGYIQHGDSSPLVNGHVHDARFQRDASVDTASLAIRNRVPKKAEREKRGSKSDGSIELVSKTLRHSLGRFTDSPG